MSHPTLESARATLVAHGIDVFRIEGGLIQLATRVRTHLMDAGVAVLVGDHGHVQFTVRAQASDFPGVSADGMFAKVREAVVSNAAIHGFEEVACNRRRITDPVDASLVLDVWYELTFAKPLLEMTQLLADVCWALNISKCIGY